MTIQQFNEIFAAHPQFGQLSADRVIKKAAAFKAGEEVTLVKLNHRPRDIKNRLMTAKVLGHRKWGHNVVQVMKPEQVQPLMKNTPWFSLFNFTVA